MKYLHGGDIYRNPAEYDFSVNINPLGMPEGSIRAAREGILLSDRYPDYQGEKLCRAVAGAKGTEPGQILLGNGAAELIYALCHALRPGKALAAAPCFQEYEAAVRSAGGTMLFRDLSEESGFVLEEGILSAITEETELLFLCNPNNPTGTLAERNLLERIALRCEETGTYFCLDECFLPFLEEEREWTMLGEFKNFPHLIILRAFTKIYGMPGLRLGYAVSADRELLERIRQQIQPWNTSIPAQLAGIAALKDREYLVRTRKLIREEKEYLRRELLDGLAERVYASEANYLFFKSRPDLKERLLEKKILIRSCGNYRNLTEGFFRIGVRTHEENKELIRRWRLLEKERV